MCIVHDKDPDYEPPQPVTIRRRPTSNTHSQRTSNVVIARPVSHTSHPSIRRISIVDVANTTTTSPRPSQYVAGPPSPRPAHANPNRTSIPRIVHAPDPPQRVSGTVIIATDSSPRGSRSSLPSRHSSRHSHSHSRHGSGSTHGHSARNSAEKVVYVARTSRGRDVNIVADKPSNTRRDGSYERTSKMYLTATQEAADLLLRDREREPMYLEEPVRRSRSITYETNPRYSSSRVSERARVLVEEADGRRREYYRSPATTS